MRVRRASVAVFLVAATVAALVGAATPPADIDGDLEDAKVLLREARFAQAVAMLQGVVVRLEQAGEARARSARLGEAHLHLALAYLALDDPAAASESLKALARADPARRLDPDVYAPKVIELMRDARSQVEREAADSSHRPEQAAAGATERSRSRAPLILALAGAGAGGAAAALAAGGGDGETAAAAPPSAAPVPSPAPASGAGPDIAFVGSAPAPGSQVSVDASLQLTFTLTTGRDLAAHALHVVLGASESGHPPFTNADCSSVHSPLLPLRAGESRTVTVDFRGDPPRTCTPLPFTTTVVGAALEPCDVVPTCMDFGRAAVVRYFNLAYTLVP
jgi:hypothetical protein